jgi:hypothetical protein
MKPKLIPNDALVKVKVQIKPGGYDHINKEWTPNGIAARHSVTSPVHLAVNYTVLTGDYYGHQIPGVIELYADNDEYYEKIGKAFIKHILCSAYGLSLYDRSPRANQRRRIKSVAALEGIEFLARIGLRLNANLRKCNTVNWAITCDHKEYAALMHQASVPAVKPESTKFADYIILSTINEASI